MFEIPKDANVDKKVVNELMSPDKKNTSALKKPQNEIFEKKTDKLLTNDGRELFNENK